VMRDEKRKVQSGAFNQGSIRRVSTGRGRQGWAGYGRRDLKERATRAGEVDGGVNTVISEMRQALLSWQEEHSKRRRNAEVPPKGGDIVLNGSQGNWYGGGKRCR